MKDRKIRFCAAAMAAVCLTVGAAVAAGEGTQADPLITLSYLNQTAIPAVLEQVDGKAQAYQEELAGELDQAIQQYTAKMEELVGDKSAQQHAATYTVVTLKKDQQLNMDIGCEVMLRIGTAQCVSTSNPGLINTTTGAILNNGKDLEVNHLYMATITGRAIKATANTTKVLVRGGYTIV
ncbi:MAG: hypothetical protein IKB79_02120 [Oscillospiraceae bacterium]|nr:hypothetical protein [Oscillospiraceae bacterium]